MLRTGSGIQDERLVLWRCVSRLVQAARLQRGHLLRSLTNLILTKGSLANFPPVNGTTFQQFNSKPHLRL